MGQMFLGVDKYKQAFCGPKGLFEQKNASMGKASFHSSSEDTNTKARNKVILSTSDGALWLLYISTVEALKIS